MKYLLKINFLLFILIIAALSCNPKDTSTESTKVYPADPSTEFDLVILNGRVMDPETNFDKVSNIGVKDGKIVIITEQQISGKEAIDAKGHVVAPGFIRYP